MIDSNYRTKYQRFIIDPLLNLSILKNLDPIFLTFCGLFFGVIIPFLLYLHLTALAIISLVLSGFFDTLDGSLARSRHLESPKGAALDITSDRIVEFSIVLGLFFYEPLTRALPCLFILGSILICITTFLVVGIFSNKDSEKSFHYSAGLIERTEAFAFFALMMLFPNGFIPLSAAFSILVGFTGLFRIYQFCMQPMKQAN